jgi:hypothetical protein
MAKKVEQQTEQFDKTGKSETIFEAVSICPVKERTKIIYKIVKLGFTMDGKTVSIETIDTTTSEAGALGKFQIHSQDVGMDIKKLRNLVRELKAKESNEEETTV